MNDGNQTSSSTSSSKSTTTTSTITDTPINDHTEYQPRKGGVIKLNVGGHLFFTSISTLCAESNSMFSAMFSGRFPIQTEEDGSVFIDRDGTHFLHILNWLRNKYIPPINDDIVKECLIIEAKYYQILSLVDHLSAPPPPSPNPNKFSQKELIVMLNQSHPSHPIQLASADLSGLDLSGLSFRGANLRFANLEGSSLKYCDLSSANLQDANLKRCDLRYSDLSHGDLQRAQLQNSQLQYSTAISCNFSDAELLESSLQNADFQNSQLSGANLQCANLQDINLNGSKLQGTSLYKAINVQRAKGLKR
ncbi:hypothetical protein SAMD00019534_021970 [Acytostelium subglobosum LB1]|uniref:hypothetical protein n=1 Tax=Acytostelium subglobosum LB1 TaxID=1410327 RepID=UPI0006450183|nr:hypothetical protein SAMD00019534_021970 [Acytostelium subglobosum LB1]GAM19022.1 hypothetical protein SAMD00019534_021970 [Acytostelium subglobosum LB1]|eukprot:XP_012756949.1 hypothetical protein SAMD00019534_021970 [Acytostelium subglobosum LB1]